MPAYGAPGTMEPTKTTAQSDATSEVAVGVLVDTYAGTLYRVAYSVLRNRHDLAEIRDTRVWLVRIVWNVVLDRKRRAKTRPETDDIADMARLLPAAGLTAEDRVSAAQHHARVLRAVEQLPEKEKRVLILSAFEELSSVEIAQVLGTTESTVRSRLFRARNLLSTLLSHARSAR